jgi:hypothetical protein
MFRASNAMRNSRSAERSFYYPSPTRYAPPGKPVLGGPDEDELVHSMKEQCNLEAELENGKMQLAHKADFNLFDCFHIFDKARTGFVGTYELQNGLSSIGVNASYDECNLVI